MSRQYTVSQINKYIKNMFTTDFLLKNVSVTGEVFNCKYHSSGHIYFTLKDENSIIPAVMFAGNRSGLDFELKNSMQLIVTGSISVYEHDGRYMLYARKIEKQGIGEQYEKLQKLKEKLEEMGMFDEMYKQPIPQYAHTVGVVTSSTGAVIRDIMNVASRRNPYVQLVLCPADVQGDGACDKICRAIEKLDKYGVDVIIVGRGGGSAESLWVFNDEKVVRAVFNCRTPVISAVGHEIDYTLTDLAADMRAPTPSAAAELAVYDLNLAEENIKAAGKHLNRKINDILSDVRDKLMHYGKSIAYLSPVNMLRLKRQHINELSDKVINLMEERLKDARGTLRIICGRLEALSPLSRLSGGYSYVTGPDGKCITSVDDISEGDGVTINVSDGRISATVTGREIVERTAQ